MKTVDESYNSATPVRIAAYDYNELGQLVKKNLHALNNPVAVGSNVILGENDGVSSGQEKTVLATQSITLMPGFTATAGSNFSAKILSQSASGYLQSVDYRYNIRGQITSINNSTLSIDSKNDDANDVFGMDLLYDVSDGGIGSAGYFNGMISGVKWKVNAPGVSTTNERSYKFSYDKLMRLNSALYADRSGTGSWANNGAFDEKNMSYDINGNILTLQRNAVLSGSVSAVDHLSYSYDGNRLLNVSDGVGGSYALFGFKNLTGSVTAYSYDANGNMIGDPKKGVNLEYNVLNRTEKIIINTSSGRFLNYTYDAGGGLIRKQAYDNNSLVKTTDYIDGFVYEDNVLTYFGMSEGRVRNSNGTLKLEYMIKDQQGNVRVSFEEQNGGAVVRQENSYYPFGLTMPGSVVPTAANKNLYNGGSEWQNDFGNMPDLQQTFYRMYDAALGRFISVDPLAEASESLTSYQYALNNPILFNDPFGDQAAFTSKRTGPGSGNHWSDGINNNDWTLYGGSEMYKNGISSGMTDWNGTLYYSYSLGQSLISKHGDHGYYTFEGRISDYSYAINNTTYNVFLNKTVGPHGTWHSIDPQYSRGAITGPVPWYGNFLGPGPPDNPYRLKGYNGKTLKPINMLDAAAQRHDYAYYLKKTGGVSGALFNRQVSFADLALAISAAEVMTRWELGQNDTITGKPISAAEAAWAESVSISFGLLGSIKLGTYGH